MDFGDFVNSLQKYSVLSIYIKCYFLDAMACEFKDVSLA